MFVVGKFFFSFGEKRRKKMGEKNSLHDESPWLDDDDDIVLVSF